MTSKEYAWAAVDIVIDLAKENGLKYRRGDFEFVGDAVDIITESERGLVRERNLVAGTLLGVVVALRYDFPRTKKKLKERRCRFREYTCCADGFKGLYFKFSFDDLSGEAPYQVRRWSDLSAAQEGEEEHSFGGCGDCVCGDCMMKWSNRCPYGDCYDDHRAKVKPYDASHPSKPPRTSWSNWYKDQAHWCRGGIFYPCKACEHYVPYEAPKIQYCLKAVTQVWPDGYVDCSLIENYGCERCYEEFMQKEAAKNTDGENGKLFDFSEVKRDLERKGCPSGWVDMVVDTTDKYAIFEPHGKPHYKSRCPFYEGYWLRGGLGSVQCSCVDGVIPGIQWDKKCRERHEECPVYQNNIKENYNHGEDRRSDEKEGGQHDLQ